MWTDPKYILGIVLDVCCLHSDAQELFWISNSFWEEQVKSLAVQMIRFLAVLNLILQTHPINTNLPEITSVGFHLVDRATSLHGPTPQRTSINPTDHAGKSHLCHPWTGKCLYQVFRCSHRFPALALYGPGALCISRSPPLGLCSISPQFPWHCRWSSSPTAWSLPSDNSWVPEVTPRAAGGHVSTSPDTLHSRSSCV